MSDDRTAIAPYARHCLTLLSMALPLAAASVVAWALVVYVNVPWAAAYVMAAAIGWALYRHAHVSSLGILLWCLAVAARATDCWLLLPGEEIWFPTLCEMTGAVLFFASSIAFLVAAWKHRPHRMGNCACCNLALFTLIAWSAGYATIGSRLRHQEAVQHTTDILVTLHNLAAEIEVIRSRLGRIPNDEEEFVALRRKPMPAYYSHYQIRYGLLDKDRYRLSCSLNSFWGHHWDLFGWNVAYHGPNEPRRVRVILF